MDYKPLSGSWGSNDLFYEGLDNNGSDTVSYLLYPPVLLNLGSGQWPIAIYSVFWRLCPNTWQKLDEYLIISQQWNLNFCMSRDEASPVLVCVQFLWLAQCWSDILAHPFLNKVICYFSMLPVPNGWTTGLMDYALCISTLTSICWCVLYFYQKYKLG